jgi:hypothetical protein
MLLVTAFLSRDTELRIVFGLAPLLYAAMGWLMGILIAWLYNFAAARGFGLELEFAVEPREDASS